MKEVLFRYDGEYYYFKNFDYSHIWICNYFGVILSNFYHFIWKDDRML